MNARSRSSAVCNRDVPETRREAPAPAKKSGRQTIAREPSRRDILCGAVGAAGLVAAGRGAAAPADDPDRLPPQTQRSLHHFHFPGETMPTDVVRAQVLVKKAAAKVNVDEPPCPAQIDSRKRSTPRV